MSLVNTSLRHFLINAPNPSFSSNLIKTAKYNMITFFPLALLYQFTNYFNNNYKKMNNDKYIIFLHT